MSYIVIILAFIIFAVRLVLQFNTDGKKKDSKTGPQKKPAFPASFDEILEDMQRERKRSEDSYIEDYEDSISDKEDYFQPVFSYDEQTINAYNDISDESISDYSYETDLKDSLKTTLDENYVVNTDKPTIEFDAKEAIIYSTILERKYID